MATLPPWVLTGLATALNHYLQLDPDSTEKLAALAGKTVAIELILPTDDPVESTTTVTVYLFCSATAIELADNSFDPPDVTLRGTPLALLRLARGTAEPRGDDIDIQGDSQVGRDLQALLLNIDIDWEEHLSRAVGDAFARQVSRTLSGFSGWSRQAVDTLLQDTAEFLQHEAKQLPPSGAVEQFLDAVDTLRSDVDRLEARIRRLQQKLDA